MKKGKAIVTAGAGLLGVLLIAFFAINNFKSPEKKQLNTAQAQVTRGNIEVSVTGAGTLTPIDSKEIAPKVTGTVEKLTVKNGDSVSKGDVIAELSNKTLENDIKSAELELANARQTANTPYAQAQRGSIDQLELNLENLKEQRKELTVKAPIAGKISGLNISEGDEYTGVTANTSTKSPLQINQFSSNNQDTAKRFGKVINLEKMLVVFPVDEVDIFKIKEGQTANIIIDALPDKTFKGKVTEVSEEGVVQNNVSSFDVTIEVDNAENILKSGLTCNVTVLANKKDNVLLIPIEALQQTGQEKYVLVATATASDKRRVEVGLTNETYAEITKGLKEGEKILLPSLVEEDQSGFRGPFGRKPH